MEKQGKSCVRKFSIWVLVIILITGCESFFSESLFKKISDSHSSIVFSNNLVYSDTLSVLEFEYMYNGAGVAVGDINNDGLQDIYFSGNMVSGRLYLNLGNLKFQDITEQAGVETAGWSNGVSMFDVNQDGFKDIYVSRGGPRGVAEEFRANLLFINNGDNTFTESAASFGLDDTGYTVQSTFFDYDKDGDLDVYLLSNALVDYNRNVSRPIDENGKAPSVDKFLINNGDNTFTDFSREAGVLKEGFGLGVQVCDINEDNWPDLYVSNDFITDDIIYINQKDGTFKNEARKYLKHLTWNGMGNDVADFNNDGLVDIVVLDMFPQDNRRRKLTMMGNNYDEFYNGLAYGYMPQYFRNTLQLNNGNGTFSEIGQLSGIDATDWSWAALFADYDNDGSKDLFISNGYRQDITNLDFMVYGQQVLQMGTPEANRKQRLDELNKLEGIKIHNYAYKNVGNYQFEDQSKDWGFDEPTFSNGAVYADLDNDGDLDLVISNIDDKASLYQNTLSEAENPSAYMRVALKGPKGNLEGIGAKVYLKYGDQIQHQFFTPVRGYLSSVEPFLHFGLGDQKEIQELKVIWPDGKVQFLKNVASNQLVQLDYTNAEEIDVVHNSEALTTILSKMEGSELGIDYTHEENVFVDFKQQQLLPHMHSKNGPGIAVGDVNGDQFDDFFVGGATKFQGSYFVQKSDGTFAERKLNIDSLSEDMGSLLFDADNDGDQDLYIVSGGSSQIPNSALFQDRLYLNDGQGNFTASDALPSLKESGSCVVAGDYDKDGDLDLFIGGRVVPGEYPKTPKSFLLRNDISNGKAKYTDITPEALSEIGMVTSALWTDYDNDSWLDLMVVGEFMPVTLAKNDNGQFGAIKTLTNSNGWWNSITAGDFDRDGDVDYIAGNLGLNTRFKVSPEEPLCIYAKDFDKNGRVDPVMCYYIDGKNYVAHSRNDLIKQINAMRGRFRTYNDFADADFSESFLKEEIDGAQVVKAEYFASSYIENLGNGEFRISQLPLEAQFSPIYGIVTADLNEDGNLDVMLTGNFYASEVSVGRYDASVGLVLLGDGAGGFDVVKPKDSGFLADGDSRGFVRLRSGQRDLFLVANNSNKMITHQGNKRSISSFRPEPNDLFAEITYHDGKVRKDEFYYGSTYLSQSSRILDLTDQMISVFVINSMGEKRQVK